MNELITLHNEAMDLALLGDKALAAGDKAEAATLYQRAYEKEREVSFMAEMQNNPEPGLSILFRSAASLAYQCGYLREAEKLITHALSGNPTKEIAAELRDLLQQIYSSDSFADEEQLAQVSYKLVVPKSETTLFTTLMHRMGWAVSNLRGSIGKIAMF